MSKVRRLGMFFTFASISGELIDAYRKADCMAPTFAKGVEPPTRGWDAPLPIAGGATATVQGADLGQGRITVRYGDDASGDHELIPCATNAMYTPGISRR
jgi:hypothetical protein